MRETLIQTGKVGIANVVLRNKQHLAVVMPLGKALVMNTLRWADEVRGVEYLELRTKRSIRTWPSANWTWPSVWWKT